MNWYLKVLKQYAVFNGRARRKEYWMFALINLIIGFCLGLTEGLTGMFGDTDESVFGAIYQLLIFVPSLAVGVRRMHDVGKSGWYLLIPIYNFILAVREGNTGINKYGDDPKGFTQQSY
jgi:uncharacterized membrane protein YhaH (DUF805 family)|tara:strand:+ start:30 stop:386 length:357 start_codon:yes stop_codon:yes gene_type:complete